jgi:diacylglycerol kinase family enzyme
MDAGDLDGRLFFNIAGFGLDAIVAHRFAAGGLKRRGFARYMELATRELFCFEPVEYSLTIDGVSATILPLIVAIANSRQYGNGALIAPQARIDDGKLDVVVVDNRSPWTAMFQIRQLFSGDLAQVPGVSMSKAAEVEITSGRPLVFHVDGEPHLGGLSVKARVHPGVLRVRSPR